MEAHRFDDVARSIGGGVLNRRTVVGALMAVIGAGFGARRSVGAQTCSGSICTGSAGGKTCCPPGWFCCSLDSGNETCCGGTRPLCDPTFTCQEACPAGRATCGTFCCRANQRCDPATTTCVGCPAGKTYCPSGECVDVQTDPANCGGCGFDCRDIDKEFCEDGQCRGECETNADCADGVCHTCVENRCTPICGTNQICCLVSEGGSNQSSAWCCSSTSTCCGLGLCCSFGERCEDDVCKVGRKRSGRRNSRRRKKGKR